MARNITMDELVDENTPDIMFLKDADGGVWCLGRASSVLNLRNAQVITFGKLKEPVILLSYEETLAELAADEDRNVIDHSHH